MIIALIHSLHKIISKYEVDLHNNVLPRVAFWLLFIMIVNVESKFIFTILSFVIDTFSYVLDDSFAYM